MAAGGRHWDHFLRQKNNSPQTDSWEGGRPVLVRGERGSHASLSPVTGQQAVLWARHCSRSSGRSGEKAQRNLCPWELVFRQQKRRGQLPTGSVCEAVRRARAAQWAGRCSARPRVAGWTAGRTAGQGTHLGGRLRHRREAPD